MVVEKLSYSIVPGTCQDASAIALLGARVFSDTFGYSMSSEDVEQYLEASYNEEKIRQELTQDEHHFYVAKDEQGKVLGFAQLTTGSTKPCLTLPPSEAIELQRIYTDSNTHGNGVGTALLQTALNYAAPKFKSIWLGVWEDNVKAQRFYERHGFVRIGEHDFKIGSCIQTDWILELRFK